MGATIFQIEFDFVPQCYVTSFCTEPAQLHVRDVATYEKSPIKVEHKDLAIPRDSFRTIFWQADACPFSTDSTQFIPKFTTLRVTSTGFEVDVCL